jgi:hypothetical protein
VWSKRGPDRELDDVLAVGKKGPGNDLGSRAFLPHGANAAALEVETVLRVARVVLGDLRSMLGSTGQGWPLDG